MKVYSNDEFLILGALLQKIEDDGSLCRTPFVNITNYKENTVSYPKQNLSPPAIYHTSDLTFLFLIVFISSNLESKSNCWHLHQDLP
jgi:hypothetical protein